MLSSPLNLGPDELTAKTYYFVRDRPGTRVVPVGELS